MNKMNLPAAALLAVLAAGCSSAAAIKYYSLDSSDYFTENSQAAGPRLHVKEIAVPAYLNTNSFVMRVSGHEVVYTNENKWVDTLESLLNPSLLKNLKKNLPDTPVTRYRCGTNEKCGELRLTVNNFEVTDRGFAVVDFEYSYVSPAGAEHTATVHREKKLERDGYESMVSSLNGAWQEGVAEMAEFIRSAN